MEDVGGFHVEHYRPKDKFNELISDYNNLFYSCAACNRYKGNYWSDNWEKMIVNPCNHVMSHHLTFDKQEIVSLSAPGTTTLKILNLNSPQSLKYRALMQKLIILLLQNLSRVNIKDKRIQVDESLEMLAQLIGEDINFVKGALKITLT